ncbi:MAG: AAA family ATPase [Hyphomicrobiaceae bacterium]|nr:AAA family ATPase [Hyphomicrobiaceae bacterium]
MNASNSLTPMPHIGIDIAAGEALNHISPRLFSDFRRLCWDREERHFPQTVLEARNALKTVYGDGEDGFERYRSWLRRDGELFDKLGGDIGISASWKRASGPAYTQAEAFDQIDKLAAASLDVLDFKVNDERQKQAEAEQVEAQKWLAANPEELLAYDDETGESFAWRLKAPANDTAPEPTYGSRRMSDIEEKPISWLWEDRIARGKITLIGGVPKLGKSQLSCAFTAAVTTAGLWPDGTRAPLGSVVLITAEDDAADTIRPRLRAVGADLSRVHLFDYAVRGGKNQQFDIGAHTGNLRAMIKDIGDVKLVVIDPVLAYMGKADSHKNADVRGALVGLQTLAAELGIAVILITHTNKNDAGGQSAMNRLSASGAFSGVARGIWLGVKDPDDETGERRLFVPVGANIGNDREGFAFRIESVDLGNGIKTSRVVFEAAAVQVDADELVSAQRRDGAAAEAETLLRAELANGERPEKALREIADQEGISLITLRRAAKKIGVLKRKPGKNWLWKLPSTGASDPSEEFSELIREAEEEHGDHNPTL